MKHFLERIYAASPAALQTLALDAYGWKIRRERFGAEYHRWQRIFAENERRAPRELAALQDEAVDETSERTRGTRKDRGAYMI